MARKKKYNEVEVIEKAMDLFWRNGYETTSVRMLEKEMGINQFSIYSSFGSKEGVFLESIKCYKGKLNSILDKLEASTNGVDGIKTYFYDFLAFSKANKQKKGCLINNALNEFGDNLDPAVRSETDAVFNTLKKVLREKLALDSEKDPETLTKQVNYLLVSLQGLAAGSKIFEQQQLDDFIESTFKNL